MAVLQKIRELLVPVTFVEPEMVVPAPMTTYEIRLLTDKHLKELLRLSFRCFKDGENYTKHTFAHLLDMPNGLSFQIVTAKDEMVGFMFITITNDGIGHITTIAIAPEHRRRGLAAKILGRGEEALKTRSVSTAVLEVRVSNRSAQSLYHKCGYAITQRAAGYYNNGEDCFIMVKSLSEFES